MSHRDRERAEKAGSGDKAARGGKKSELQQQMELVNSLVEEVRTLDSEIDLLKQKTNLIVREINVLKHVVLSEKTELKELEDEKERDKSRFESILNIVKSMKSGDEGSSPPVAP